MTVKMKNSKESLQNKVENISQEAELKSKEMKQKSKLGIVYKIKHVDNQEFLEREK